MMVYDIVSERNSPDSRIANPGDAFELVRRYGSKRQEMFLCLSLRGDHSVSRVRIVSIGLMNKTLVHPREVFMAAIKDNAAAVILAHNHPSGNVEPSEDDTEVTKRMVEAGEILGIPVLDHLVFGRATWYSFAERGRLPAARWRG
jgi:DNA repair protein RadC